MDTNTLDIIDGALSDAAFHFNPDELVHSSLSRLSLDVNMFSKLYNVDGFNRCAVSDTLLGKLDAYIDTLPANFIPGVDVASILKHVDVRHFMTGPVMAGLCSYLLHEGSARETGLYESVFASDEPLDPVILSQLNLVVPAVVGFVCSCLMGTPSVKSVADLESSDLFQDKLTALVDMLIAPHRGDVLGAKNVFHRVNPLKFFAQLVVGQSKSDVFRGIDVDLINKSLVDSSLKVDSSRVLSNSMSNSGFMAGFVSLNPHIIKALDVGGLVPVNGPEDFANGLSEMRCFKMPDNFAPVLHPSYISLDSIKLLSVEGRSKKVSPLNLFYGFSPTLDALLRKLVIGDAALRGFSPNILSELFKTTIANRLSWSDKVKIDVGDGSDGPIDMSVESYLKSCISDAGGLVTEKGFSSRISLFSKFREMNLDCVTGPQALTDVLNALGGGDPETASILLDHQKFYKGSNVIVKDLARSRFLQGFESSSSSLLSRMQVPMIPIFPLPRPQGLQGAEAVKDPQHTLLDSIGELIVTMNDVGGADINSLSRYEYETKLQVLLGYYLFGAGAYDSLNLPFERVIDCSPKLTGLYATLAQKNGDYRSLYAGVRLPYSARMVATADTELAIGTIGVPANTMLTLRAPVIMDHILTDDYIAGLKADVLKVFEKYGSKFPDSLSPVEGDTVVRYMKALYQKAVVKAFDNNSPSANMLSELKKQMGATRGIGKELAEVLRLCGPCKNRVEESFIADVTSNFLDVDIGYFRYIMGDKNIGLTDLRCDNFLNRISRDVLTSDVVFEPLRKINEENLILLSRYPRLHVQSFQGVGLVLNKQDEPVIRTHPLTAKPLNLDFDGDCLDTLAWAFLNEKTRAQMDRLSLKRAIFAAGNASGLAFGLDLNALEGLIKANTYFCPCLDSASGQLSSGVPSDVVELSSAQTSKIVSFLDDYFEQGFDKFGVLAQCEKNPDTLNLIYSSLLVNIKEALAESGDVDLSGVFDRADTSIILRSPSDPDSGTSLARLFVHKIVGSLTDSKIVEDSFGPLFVKDGERTFSNVKKLESQLLRYCVDDNGVSCVASALVGLYNFGCKLAQSCPGSISVTGLDLGAQLEYIQNDPVVGFLKDTFLHRVGGYELAWSSGILTQSEYTSKLLLVEHGSGSNDDSWKKKYDELRAVYLKSTFESRESAYAAVAAYVKECLQTPAIGLKPLVRCCVELACDRYEFEYKCPHMWVEQILSGEIKAKEEILTRTTVGFLNTVWGQAVAPTYKSIVEGLDNAATATAGFVATHRSILSKTQVSVGGTLLKDLLSLCQNVVVGGKDVKFLEDDSGARLKYEFKDFFSGKLGSTGKNLDVLADLCKFRNVKIYANVNKASAAVLVKNLSSLNGGFDLSCGKPFNASAFLENLNTEFSKLVRRVPFDTKLIGKFISCVQKLDPDASLGVFTPMYDGGLTQGVDPRALGVHAMYGLEKDGDFVLRQALETMNEMETRFGVISAGSLGENATQTALRFRHVGGSKQELYNSIADYWKMKFGPFPNRSPYFRSGALEIVSVNPFDYPALVDLGMGSAFVAAVSANVPDTKGFVVARELIKIGEIEIFPGECYQVNNGELTVGTSRPDKYSFSAVDVNESKLPKGVSLIAPDEVVVQLTDAALARVFPDLLNAADFEGQTCFSTIGDKDYSVFSVEGKAYMPLSLVEYENLINSKVLSESDCVSVVPAKGTDYTEVDAESKGLVSLISVTDAEAYMAETGCYVPKDSVLNVKTGFWERSTLDMTSDTTQGFRVFLDYLNGSAISPQKSVLSEVSGTVKSIKVQSSGAISNYAVEIVGLDGVSVKYDLKLPLDSFPSVVVGQTLEKGDPLNFGYVSLEDRASLREDFRSEFMKFMTGYFSENGKCKIWSAHLELISSVMVSKAEDGKYRFETLKAAAKSLEDPAFVDFVSNSTRYGDLSCLLQHQLLGSVVVNGPLAESPDSGVGKSCGVNVRGLSYPSKDNVGARLGFLMANATYGNN